jgi:site-specific DNA-methyltransferase (adenine-specific)
MNPPYGREIGAWMRKAWSSAEAGALVVCLVPARTDTAWWHDYAVKGDVEFLRGRLKFGGHKNSAPFPSAVVVFDGR